MNLAILLVTHTGLGLAIQQTVEEIMGEPPLPVICIEPGPNESIEQAKTRAILTAQQIKAEHDGLLILTDAYGATPCNIAVAVGQTEDAPVIAGLNLPMMLRIMSYPSLGPEKLAAKALSTAEDGITVAHAQHTSVR